MSRKLRFLCLTVCALAASGVLVTSAQAALLAYEPFNYAPGTNLWTDNNQVQTTPSLGGDFGWKEPWRATGNNNDVNIRSLAGSFGYAVAGRTLVTAGNRMQVSGNASATGDNFGGVDATISPWRRLNAVGQRGFGASQSTWISFLAQVTTAVPGNYTGIGADGGTIAYGRGVGPVQLFRNQADNVANDDPAMGNNGQGDEMLSFGRGTQNAEDTALGGELGLANDTWGMLNRGDAPQVSVSSTPLTNLVFMVVRINHATGTDPRVGGQGDVAYAWINPPSLVTEPNTALAFQIDPDMFQAPHPVGAAVNDRDYNFNRIRIFAGNINATVGTYASVAVDEIRMGETYDDVTPDIVPEPGSAAMAAFGLLALAARRRK